MRRWVIRSLVASLVASVFVMSAPTIAGAATPTSLLSGGATLGEIFGVNGVTNAVGVGGPCASESHPGGYEHAAVYRTAAEQTSLLRLTATDDLGGTLSLCAIGIHAAEGSSPDLTSEPLDTSDGCAIASTCSIDLWLEAGRTYDIVLWAVPPEQGSQEEAAEFSFNASVKLPAILVPKIHGHRLTDVCTGYKHVVVGKVFSMTAATPSASTGNIHFLVQRKSGSSWINHASYNRPLSAGVATLSLTAGASGSFRMTAALAETATRLGVARTLYVAHVTPKWQRYSDGGVRLKVPYYHQQMRLSCEAATLRMAHNYFKAGHIDSDWDVLKHTGVDKRKKKGNRWGNPNKDFVGNPKGKMMSTGYGVHWAPIAYAATKFNPCRPALILKKPSRSTISKYVAMGFPVIVWGAHRGATGIYKKKWKAWDGDWITAYSVEHVWVIVGFHGKVGKPQSFIIHDPSGGGYRKVSLKAYDAFTKYFKRAVVVRG
jgi:uncharacterized protein YvpB